MIAAVRTGLWLVFVVFGPACLLVSLFQGRTPFTQQLFAVALVAFLLASLLELKGARR